ncbi:hypothetical protein Mapa_000958 [Marchantia paleacea]|nr:hypothetical protein Mapa_000958 [Marchantia paleacea]
MKDIKHPLVYNIYAMYNRTSVHTFRSSHTSLSQSQTVYTFCFLAPGYTTSLQNTHYIRGSALRTFPSAARNSNTLDFLSFLQATRLDPKYLVRV